MTRALTVALLVLLAPALPGAVQLGESLDQAVAHYEVARHVPDALVKEIASHFSRSEGEIRRLLADKARGKRAAKLRQELEALTWTADPLRFAVALGKNSDGAEEYWFPRSSSVMIAVPSGTYVRGTVWVPSTRPIQERPGWNFLLDRYEVTVARYDTFLQATGHRRPRSWNWQLALVDRPVVDVSWDDAMAYASWSGLTLPTEEEWEQAAFGRGRRMYPWGNRRPSPRELPSTRLHRVPYSEVSEFPRLPGTTDLDRSPWGFRDMAWNLREWCVGSTSSNMKLVKGGSFVDDPRELRHLWSRRFLPARQRFRHVGFRLALPLRPGRLPVR